MTKKMISENIRLFNIILIVLMINLFTGCTPDILSTKPKASFEYLPTKNIKTGDTITFTNLSKNADLYHWDFGDSCSSNEKDPKHAFNNKKSYLVKLSVAKQTEIDGNYAEETDSLCKSVNVSIGLPNARFGYKRTSNFAIAFIDSSFRVTNYFWDFGDGTTSTEKNPTHIFGSFGSYNVKLIVSNDGFSDVLIKTINITDVVSLNNIKPQNYPSPPIKVDVDYDGVTDFEFAINYQSHPISGLSYEASFINALNGYAIFTDTAVTKEYNNKYWPNAPFTIVKMVIPKIYSQGSTIINSNKTKTGNVGFCVNNSNSNGLSSSFGVWISNVNRYVGFRKIVGDKTRIGWIKLLISNYANVTLISYKIPTDGENLVINK